MTNLQNSLKINLKHDDLCHSFYPFGQEFTFRRQVMFYRKRQDTVKGTLCANQEDHILLNYLKKKNTPMKLNILEDVVPQCQKTAS